MGFFTTFPFSLACLDINFVCEAENEIIIMVIILYGSSSIGYEKNENTIITNIDRNND